MTRPLYTDDHQQFRMAARRFVANEIVPNFEKWEADGIIDRGLFAQAGELGLLGMAVPEELGGGGVDDFRYNVVVNEEIHLAGCNGVGLGVALHNDIVLPVLPHLLHRRAATALAARDRLGRADHGHRHDRAGHRQRPGLDVDLRHPPR